MRLVVILEKGRRKPPDANQLPLGLVHVKPHQRDGHPVAGYDRKQEVAPDPEPVPLAPAPEAAPVPVEPPQASTWADTWKPLYVEPTINYVRELRDQKRGSLATAIERALERYHWPNAYAWLLGRTAERLMRDGKTLPNVAVRHAAAGLRNQIENPPIVTDADRATQGPTSYAQIREGIDAWEDAHREEGAEHLHLVIASGPLAGQVYEHTPATTIAMSDADPAGVVAVSPQAMLVAQLTQSAILTHNHPSNSCLSLQDMTLAVSLNAAEIRATTRDGVWVAIRPNAGWPEPYKVDAALQTAAITARNKIGRSRGSTYETIRDEARAEWARILPEALDDLGITLAFHPKRVRGRGDPLRKAVDPGRADGVGTGAGARLIVWLRKAAEQIGLFGQVKAHDRHTESGKTVHVKQHRRKRGPLTDEQFLAIRRKQQLRMELTPEEQEQHAAQLAYNETMFRTQKAGWARLHRDGIDHNGRQGMDRWLTWSSYGKDGIPDWQHLYAMHPDGQVRARITGDVAVLQTRVDGLSDEWVDHGTVPKTSSVRVEGDLVARDMRRKFGPMSDLSAAKNRAEQEASDPPRPTRWGYSNDTRWAQTWGRARDHLRGWFGEIRAKKTIREIRPGVVRADVEVVRMSDGAVVGRGSWIDETGREDDGKAALWQLPHGATLTLPEGLDQEPSYDGKPRKFWLDWGALDRPAVATTASQVMVRPIGYGIGQHLDPTILVHRTDDEDTTKELLATMALQHAVQQAVDRKHGFGDDLPEIAWPPPPARGETYKEPEFRSVIGMKRDRAPEVETLKAEVEDWQKKMRREVGDTAFAGVTSFSGETGIPNVREDVGYWAEKAIRDSERQMQDSVEQPAALPMTQAGLDQHWQKFWTGYERAIRSYLDTASDPTLYEKRTTPEYILERLMGPEMGPSRDHRSETLAQSLLERRGYSFGRRARLPEFYELRGPHAWAKYTEARKANAGGGTALQLTSPAGDVHSAQSVDAVHHYERLKGAIRDLGENPHHKLVERGHDGKTWWTSDPFGNRLWHYDTQREARQKSHDNLVRMVSEAERAAGSAAVAATG